MGYGTSTYGGSPYGGGGTPLSPDTGTDFYTNLITSEHRKPKFISLVDLLVQPMVNLGNLYLGLIDGLDIDLAVGDQLDILGEWLGWDRNAPSYDGSVPLTSQWVKEAHRDPMNDTNYRALLKSAIQLNHWDGTIQGMYDVWNSLGVGPIIVQDNQDMSLGVIFLGSLNGLIPYFLYNLVPRPAGVGIKYYTTGAPAGQPTFGFGLENSTISGYGVGYWLKKVLQ
jgi:hypothetical protein